MKMQGVSFKYPTATEAQLTNACCVVTLASRVAIVGANGAGKTTLLKLIVGETDIGGGTFERHENLRLSYIAQHSMHHVEDYLEKTPVQYIMYRFQEGMDKEMAKFSTMLLSEDELELSTKSQGVLEVIGRANRAGKLWYELIIQGRKQGDTKWEPLQFIEKMPPYVLKLCRHYDEKLKAQQSGLEVRPITTPEIKKHLYDFGIAHGLEDGKIKRMSGGQKCRLVLAAALWSMPHIIALVRERRASERAARRLARRCLPCATLAGCSRTRPHGLGLCTSSSLPSLSPSDCVCLCLFSARFRLPLRSLSLAGRADQLPGQRHARCADQGLAGVQGRRHRHLAQRTFCRGRLQRAMDGTRQRARLGWLAEPTSCTELSRKQPRGARCTRAYAAARCRVRLPHAPLRRATRLARVRAHALSAATDPPSLSARRWPVARSCASPSR
jgi:ABC-type dipeptide/oligopeptide/nickel transport system ATPase subunit